MVRDAMESLEDHWVKRSSQAELYGMSGPCRDGNAGLLRDRGTVQPF